MEQTNVRRGGVLLHITSLPGPECAGTLGEAAYRFVDFLQSAGMRIWQVLPVGPTGYGESPYQSACALAGNPYMIDLALLQKDGYLPDYQPAPHANEHGVMMLGDMPIYVAEDSSDVWANAKFFQLNCERRPKRVAGVPPDYFSEDGQLWGNPLYRWHYLRLHGYGFWMDRLRAMAQLYDSVRIDHFIGFANYYSVKAGEKTARNGKWVIGPGKAFFAAVKKKVPELNVVAEDLGAVNDRVRNLLAFCGYPGMKVLQFAYDGGGGDNSHQPQLYQPNCAAYTGTHDNDTSLGWWRACSDQTRRNLREALGEVDDSTVVWRMIKAVFDSRANIAMAPMQDYLGLDSSARMNTPGTVGEKNWRYRALSSDFSAELAARMRALCEESGRV